MRLPRFAFFTGLGAGIWCGILVYIGWLIGQHEAALGDAARKAFTAEAHTWVVYRVLPAVAVLLVAYVVWHRARTRVVR
jgi:membrane protein DedA with SNARE-associated domain